MNSPRGVQSMLKVIFWAYLASKFQLLVIARSAVYCSTCTWLGAKEERQRHRAPYKWRTDMYPIRVYFEMFIQFGTTMTLIRLRLTIKPAC